jgi:sulfate/thiosulfate transport system substrate-binding protein
MSISSKASRRLVAASLTGMLALTACSTNSSSAAEGGTETVDVNAFSVLEAANEPVFEDFQGTPAGEGVEFATSYGASGDQSRAVVAGADADVVHYSLESDVTRLVDEGLVAEDWKDTPTKGIATSSVVVFVVRKGNPEGIETWDDLVKPGVEIITPNPGSSGSARWNILAAWAHVTGAGGSEKEATSFLTDLLGNTIALPGSGREATTAFTDGSGDVLLSYENEAILARQSGAEFDYVIPDETLLIENPCTVTEAASSETEAFLDYQKSEEGQAAYAATGYRPLVDVADLQVEGANDSANPYPEPATLQTIDDDFGGWDEANTKFFDENDGIIAKIQAEAGQ